MREIEVFILWDESPDCEHDKIYLDEESAKIGLEEYYTDFWIKRGYAKIKRIKAVSYFESE